MKRDHLIYHRNQDKIDPVNNQVEYYSSKKLKSSLSQDVYREILDRLMNNRLVPGDIINRREIANQLGVSVAPVLEALLQLEMEGFLESIPRKGTIIKPIKQEDVYGHLMIREALECQGVRLYCGELVRKNRDRLIACSEELEKSSTESPEHWKEEIQFHYMLIELAGCRVLSSELSRTMRLGLFYQIQRTIIPSDRLIRQSHIDLVHRLETDDKDEAEQVIRAHLRSGKENIFKEMERMNAINRGEAGC